MKPTRRFPQDDEMRSEVMTDGSIPDFQLPTYLFSRWVLLGVAVGWLDTLEEQTGGTGGTGVNGRIRAETGPAARVLDAGSVSARISPVTPVPPVPPV